MYNFLFTVRALSGSGTLFVEPIVPTIQVRLDLRGWLSTTLRGTIDFVCNMDFFSKSFRSRVKSAFLGFNGPVPKAEPKSANPFSYRAAAA